MSQAPDDRLLRLLRAYTAEADSFMDCSTDAEGNFSDPADEREYERMVAIISDARRALGLSIYRSTEEPTA